MTIIQRLCPGYGDGYAVYYGDDNARLMLGIIMAAAAQNTDRYDKRLLILGYDLLNHNYVIKSK